MLSDAVLYECRARGLFRKNGVSPLVGDWVEIEETGEEKGYVTRILDRKNSLIRPPLANLDQLFLVVSVADPQPNLLVLDKLIAIAEHKKIEPLLIVTKTDLGNGRPLAALYEKAGFQVFAPDWIRTAIWLCCDGLWKERSALSAAILVWESPAF